MSLTPPSKRSILLSHSIRKGPLYPTCHASPCQSKSMLFCVGDSPCSLPILLGGSSRCLNIFIRELFPVPQAPLILIVRGVVVYGEVIKACSASAYNSKP